MEAEHAKQKRIIAPPIILEKEEEPKPEKGKRKFEDIDSETEEDEEEANPPLFVVKTEPKPPPQREEGAGASHSGDGGDGGAAAQDDEALGLPCSHQIILRGHTRAVAALGMTPKGDRMITGGNDGKIFMWDFNGMTSALRSFRNVEPYENYPVVACPFSCTGDRFLAATGQPQIKIYNRDGLELAKLIKGIHPTPNTLTLTRTVSKVTCTSTTPARPKATPTPSSRRSGIPTSATRCSPRATTAPSGSGTSRTGPRTRAPGPPARLGSPGSRRASSRRTRRC